MPLKRGKSQAVISENISELHSGETHARTAKKFGKRKADKQSVAIAMSEARKGFAKKASHNPPKPHHAKTAGKHVPRHLRGRGMISEGALAIMGKKLASEAQPPHGHVKQAMAKSPPGKHAAKAAKPWKGQKLPGWASPEHGKQDAERAHSDEERTN
jgi:hypothetical protein